MGSQYINGTPDWVAFQVPAGVTSLTVDMAGGQGGAAVGDGLSGSNALGGYGARIQFTMSVTPNEWLYVAAGFDGNLGNGVSGPNYAGGLGGQGYPTGTAGTSTYYGGTGGGMTVLRRTSSSGTVVAVAGGGGGGGIAAYPGVAQNGGRGGHGGSTSTSAIVAGENGVTGGGATGGVGGQGGQTAQVGAGAGFGGTNGYAFASGGYGGAAYSDSGWFWGLGGGGGSGWYGGGGGGRDTAGSSNAGGGGGGGASYVNTTYASSIQHTRGYQFGHGYLQFSWAEPNTTPVVQSSSLGSSPHTSASITLTATIYDPDAGQTKYGNFGLERWNGSSWVTFADLPGSSSTSTSPFVSSLTLTDVLVDGDTYRGLVSPTDGVNSGSTTYGSSFTVDLSSDLTATRTDPLGISDSRAQVASSTRTAGSNSGVVVDENGNPVVDENGASLSDGNGQRDSLSLSDSATFFHDVPSVLIEVTVKRVLVGT